MIPLAFYAPLKAPDHAVPSGDRTVARLLMRALAEAGFVPSLESRLGTRDAGGRAHPELRAASEREATRILEAVGARPAAARPRLWFTYHVYYKAPDWIGPIVSRALGIPYVIAEGSRARKRARGPHAIGHAGAEAALDAAPLLLAMTEHDREALEQARPSRQQIVLLPPFTDALPGGIAGPAPPGPPRLLAVGMMRAGDKLDSYRLLADCLASLDCEENPCERRAIPGAASLHLADRACLDRFSLSDPHPEAPAKAGLEGGLQGLPRAPEASFEASAGASAPQDDVGGTCDRSALAGTAEAAGSRAMASGMQAWTLDIVGDGPERPAVEALFAPWGARVRLHGLLDAAALASLYARAACLVWPAVNEAYGMALLEAQAHGCPVIAGGYGGVREAMRDGETGLVTVPGDAAALAEAVRLLLADAPRRAAMAAAARAFVRDERGIPSAAARLRAALLPLLTSPRDDAA